MLTVTVFTFPLNLRCSTAGIFLALGMETVPLLKSEVRAAVLRALEALSVLAALE